MAKCRERSWGWKHKIDQYITPSLIPRFSTPPVFDHLQHAQTEGEDLGILSSMAWVEWILTLILKYLTVTVTTFTQCGLVEDHSWCNEVIVMPGQITSTYQLPPHIMTKALSSLSLILFFPIESRPLILFFLIQFCIHWWIELNILWQMFKERAMLNMNIDALGSHIYGNHKTTHS